MADTSARSLTPRYYECDPLQQLYPANYVRYLLHTALDAGAVADFGSPSVTTAEWLDRVGEIGLQILRPALFGDALDVQTTLSRQGPPVWRRDFTLRHTASGDTIATGFADLFEGDDESEAGEDAAEADVPDESAWPAWDAALPEPPLPPEYPFRAVWHVAWPHADISGHLDPAWLTYLVGDVEARASAAVGWNAERDQECGIAWQPLYHRLEMFLAIQPGDDLQISSYISDVGDDEMIRHALIERQDAGVTNEVAWVRTRWVCLSADTGQRVAIPDDWLRDLAEQMVDDEE